MGEYPPHPYLEVIVEALKKFWQKVLALHPAFKVAEGIGLMALTTFIMLMVLGAWPGSDGASATFVAGLVINSFIFFSGVMPHVDPDFDPEPINRAVDAFGAWFRSWGLLLAVIVVVMMYLSMLIIG